MSAGDTLAVTCRSLGVSRPPKRALDAARRYDAAHPPGSWQPGFGGDPVLVHDKESSPLAETLGAAWAVPIFVGPEFRGVPRGDTPLSLAPEGTFLAHYPVSFAPTAHWIPPTSLGRTVVWGTSLAQVMFAVDQLRGYGISQGADLVLGRPCHLAQFAAVPGDLKDAATIAPRESELCTLTPSWHRSDLSYPRLDGVVALYGTRLVTDLAMNEHPFLTLAVAAGNRVLRVGVIAPLGGDAHVARGGARILERFPIALREESSR